jgi:hypothetical protein
MMGFTSDGQAHPEMVAERDERLGVSSEKKKIDRADIAAPPVEDGADDWKKNEPVQIQDPTGGHEGHVP